MTSASIDGVLHTLTYDDNGAIIKYDRAGSTTLDKYIQYNAANQPVKIVVGTGLTDTNPEARDEFKYGPDGSRYFKQSTYKDGGVSKTEYVFYIGDYEHSYTPDDSDTKEVHKTSVSDILHLEILHQNLSITSELEYLHRDHLGSVDTITDENGNLLQKMAFEPFGSRKDSDWIRNIDATEMQDLLDNLNVHTSRGFTGHEHLDRTGFIHMNGRVYDPQLGRFLSPDPVVQAPGNSQSWNRYSYVMNSPVNYVDPTGYFWSSWQDFVWWAQEVVYGIGVMISRTIDRIGSIFGRGNGGGSLDNPRGGGGSSWGRGSSFLDWPEPAMPSYDPYMYSYYGPVIISGPVYYPVEDLPNNQPHSDVRRGVQDSYAGTIYAGSGIPDIAAWKDDPRGDAQEGPPWDDITGGLFGDLKKLRGQYDFYLRNLKSDAENYSSEWGEAAWGVVYLIRPIGVARMFTGDRFTRSGTDLRRNTLWNRDGPGIIGSPQNIGSWEGLAAVVVYYPKGNGYTSEYIQNDVGELLKEGSVPVHYFDGEEWQVAYPR